MQAENKNRLTKKILLTGGHAGSTAYAFTQALKKDNSYKWDIAWIGAKKAVEGDKAPTLEESTLPALGVKVYTINAGRLQRRFTRYTIPSVFKIPVGFWQAFFLISKIKPNAVVSFGGFASFPVVVIAKYFKIPVIIHEQTIVYGRANKASQAFATKIALSRPESLKYFDKKKSVVIGNPFSEEISEVKLKERMGNPPTIFITGGARGSENINEAIEAILPELLSKYNVIHQVGLVSEEKYKKLKESLAEKGSKYEVYGIMGPKNWKKAMEKADLIVSRSGANIVSELLIIKRPSILIPIPWTFMDEQTKNAEYARDFGLAKILYQKDLTPEVLLSKVRETFSDWDKITSKVKEKRSPDIDAGKKLVSLLKEILE